MSQPLPLSLVLGGALVVGVLALPLLVSGVASDGREATRHGGVVTIRDSNADSVVSFGTRGATSFTVRALYLERARPSLLWRTLATDVMSPTGVVAVLGGLAENEYAEYREQYKEKRRCAAGFLNGHAQPYLLIPSNEYQGPRLPFRAREGQKIHLVAEELELLNGRVGEFSLPHGFFGRAIPLLV